MKSNIKEMRFKGIIFDLDGVICFTDQYHYQAWKEIANILEVKFDEEVNHKLRGVSRAESLEIILGNYQGNPLETEQKQTLLDKKNRIYLSLLSAMSSKDLSPHVSQTLIELKAMGFCLAIGSSSKNAEYILKQIGLHDFFDAIVDGNQITQSKPHPEVFTKAAKKLELHSSECLVVEDAEAGIQAAHAANMQVACLGEVSNLGKGDYNLSEFTELIELVKNKGKVRERQE